MKTVVVGLGYVGLPLAIRLSQVGFRVFGIDNNEKKITNFKNGDLPFAKDEPQLKEFFKIAHSSRKITFDSSFKSVSLADIVFIAVDTPIVKRKPNFNSLISATKQISKNLKEGTIIVFESTLAPKTTQDTIVPIIEKTSGQRLNKDFYLAVVPERIRPNHIFEQLTTLSRVIGVSHKKIEPILKKIYSQITSGDIDFTDLTTAETVKNVENGFRDVNIAFANEVALACEELGINVWQVRELVNKSPFHNMHKPGAGVGGHCLPKDPWLLVSSLKKGRLQLVRQARQINDSMPGHILDLATLALKKAGKSLKESTLSILGYSYVENTDDIRNSPSESLVRLLKKKKVEYKIHDPYVLEYSKQELDSVLENSDCLILMIAHSLYKNISFQNLQKIMRTKVIVDGRNFFNKRDAESNDFIYIGVGNV